MKNRTKHVCFCTHEKVYQMEYGWRCKQKNQRGSVGVVATTANGHPTVICMCSLGPAACENTKALLATTNIPLYNPFLPFFFSHNSNISVTKPYHVLVSTSLPPRPTPSHIYIVPVVAVFLSFLNSIHSSLASFASGVSLWAFI